MEPIWGYVRVISAIIAVYATYRAVSRVFMERRRYDRVTADRIRGLG